MSFALRRPDALAKAKALSENGTLEDVFDAIQRRCLRIQTLEGVKAPAVRIVSRLHVHSSWI